MTKAEKLAIIAENMQRVYDAGYAKGKADAGGGGVTLITFTIGGTEYQAEDGMTWGEWCDSEYNTGTYYVSAGLNGNEYIENDEGWCLCDENEDGVLAKALIISGYAYTLC